MSAPLPFPSLAGRLADMLRPSDFPAEGKILAIKEDSVVFQPRAATYELWLHADPKLDGATNEPVTCLIRLSARKVYSVAGGGNIIAPIAGPPRFVQGRIKYLDAQQMVVQAGVSVVVDLPEDDSAYDLACGSLVVGRLVNISALPGATMQPAAATRGNQTDP